MKDLLEVVHKIGNKVMQLKNCSKYFIDIGKKVMQ